MIAAATASQIAPLAGNLVGKPVGGDARPAAPPSTFDAAAADKQLQSLKDAVVKLDVVVKSAGSAGADIARQKLEALKERLKMLMMMGGDPKTVAKEAAQIAKEIGEAAKDYAAASGAQGGADSGAAAEAAGDTAAAQQDAASAAGAAASQPSDPPDPGSKGASGQAAGTADPAKPDPSKASADPDPPKATQPQPAPEPTTAPAPSSSDKSHLPDPVIETARVLEASAQAIAKAALQKLKAQHKHNPDARKEADQLDQGQKDFDAAAKHVYGDTGEPSGDPSAGYSAQAQPVATPPATPPVLSVQA